MCLVSFPDPSCVSACFFNFSLSILPDSDSFVTSVLPSSGIARSTLLVSVGAANVLSLSQSALRYTCNDSQLSIGPQSSRGVFAGPGASNISLIPVRLFLNRSLSAPMLMQCNITSSQTSQIISFPFIFSPSQLGSYIQHSPTEWVTGERFALTVVASDGLLYPVLGCIMTTSDPKNGGFTAVNMSGTVLNIS